MCDQKLDVATVEAEPKSLTNIYYDCLERIFDFLDLESLMNVAGTCKRLQIAAAAKYADDYANARVQLYNNLAHNNYIQYIYDSREPSIRVFGLKFCLTFLRCFGAKILNLSINIILVFGNQYVDRYINQYCADTLISIHFARERSFSGEIFTRPFEAVQKLEFWGGKLGDQLPHYVKYFPKLNYLSLAGRTSIDENAIAVSFPHLKHLGISINENGSGLCSTENVIKFLGANQQLQSLEISLYTKFETLLDVICASKSILKLKLVGSFTDLSADQVNRFANEHSLLEELHFVNFDKFEVDDATALIPQLNSLKRFEFYVKGQTECDRFLSQLDSKWKQEIKNPLTNLISVIICRE